MKAIALVNPVLAKSALCEWLRLRCEGVGVDLQVHIIGASNRSEYDPLYYRHTHVISGEFGRTAKSRWQPGKNVLWLANSLINPNAGIFVDGGGYFNESNLCVKRTWKGMFDVDVANAAARLGWQAFAGGNADGPLLVALQVRDDMALRHYFPLCADAKDKTAAFLKHLRQHLPRGREILIRPHPNEIKRGTWDNGGIWRDDWTSDVKGSFAERLPQCSALVTVNSTCASEAALLGVPTATLGLGAFTGSGVTLECHSNPARLGELFQWSPAVTGGAQYVEALLGRHFLPYNAVGAKSAEFEAWLKIASTGWSGKVVV